MIYSRTATEQDSHELNIQNNIVDYLQLPTSIDNTAASISKFWEYSLMLKMVQEFNLKKGYILNVYSEKPDEVLTDLAKINKLELYQLSVAKFLKPPTKRIKYQLITAFGVLEYVNNEYAFVDKLVKRVDTDGYLLLTTDNSEGLNKKRQITVDDLISLSFFLEDMNFDFCSDDELNLVEYNDKSSLHSLVMKRLGN